MIPFNKVTLTGGELRNIRDAVQRSHLSGDGHYSRLCERHLERKAGARRALLTSSCTHALEMAALLTDAGPGDEFLVPAFTFPSTANAFVLRGAVPRFVDIRPDTLNIDETQVEDALRRRTRAVCIVDYAGVPCEMEALTRIARRRGVFLVEDAAQAYTATYRGRAAGTFGDFGAISFHDTKNVVCGEGGALYINRPEHIARAEMIRQKGTNRAAFYRGEVDKYTWVDVGSSYVPSELQAAFLHAQLRNDDRIRARRERIYNRYLQALRPLEKAGTLRLPVIPGGCRSAYHLFHVIVGNEKTRDRVLRRLAQKSIYALFHYQPLHLSPMGRRFGGRRGSLPVTERIASRLIRLPLYTSMPLSEVDRVAEALARSL